MKKLWLYILPIVVWACSIDPTYFDCLTKKITTEQYKVNGAFYMYDFNKDKKLQRSDWIYVNLENGRVYQLLGDSPSINNAFGWKRLYSWPSDLDPVNDINGLFVFIDFKMDQTTNFSWIYIALTGNSPKIYKLMGASANGNFIYLDLDCDGRADPLPDITITNFISPSENQVPLPGVPQSTSDNYYISFGYTGATPLQCSSVSSSWGSSSSMNSGGATSSLSSTGWSSSASTMPQIPYRWSNFPQPEGCPNVLDKSFFHVTQTDNFGEKAYVMVQNGREFWCKYYGDSNGAPIKDEVVYEWMSQDLIAKNGYHKIWYKSGELFLVEKFQMGYLEDKSYTLYKSGNIAHQVPYKNDKADGRELYYDPIGNVVNCFIVQDDYAKGFCSYKTPHQNASALYQNRAKIHWSRWPEPEYCPKTFNSSALPEPNGNNGVFDFTANAKDGTLYYFIHLSGDNYVGCRYYESGDIAEESDFIYDNTVEVLNWNGISKSWLADGRLFFVNTYVNNTLQGYTDIYSENGLLLGNLIYVNNKAEGKFTIYDQIGNIMFCEMYKHDEVVAPCN